MPAQAKANTLGSGAWENAVKGLSPNQVQQLVRAISARGQIASMVEGPQSEDPERKRRGAFFDTPATPQQSIGLGVDE